MRSNRTGRTNTAVFCRGVFVWMRFALKGSGEKIVYKFKTRMIMLIFSHENFFYSCYSIVNKDERGKCTIKRIRIMLLAAMLAILCTAPALAEYWICPVGHSASNNYCSICGAHVSLARTNGAEEVNPADLHLGESALLGSTTRVTLTAIDQLKTVTMQGAEWIRAKQGAKLLFLYCDFLNTDVKSAVYSDRVSIKAVYDGRYVYTGSLLPLVQAGKDTCTYKESEVGPMYTGYYAAVIDLPDAVTEGPGPLYVELSMGANQLIYYIRK